MRHWFPSWLPTLLLALGLFVWCATCGWLVRGGWGRETVDQQVHDTLGMLGMFLAFLACLRWWPYGAWWAWVFMASLVVGVVVG